MALLQPGANNTRPEVSGSHSHGSLQADPGGSLLHSLWSPWGKNAASEKIFHPSRNTQGPLGTFMNTSNMEFLFKCEKCKTSPLIYTSGSLGTTGKQKQKTLEFHSCHCAFEARSRKMTLSVLEVNGTPDASVCAHMSVCTCVRGGRGHPAAS